MVSAVQLCKYIELMAWYSIIFTDRVSEVHESGAFILTFCSLLKVVFMVLPSCIFFSLCFFMTVQFVLDVEESVKVALQ